MLFSVIIPVYNVEPYLRECLESVLNQTFTNWEGICVNDGSTDRSAAILEEYAEKDRRFKVITQPNGGLSAARNTGLDAAKGDYVLFLDSDDWLKLNALEVIANALDGEDMLCFSGMRYYEETKSFNPADPLMEKAYNSGMSYYDDIALLHRDFAFVCVVLRAYKRSFLVENGLRFKEGIFHEDNLFTPMVCYYAGRVRQIKDCLYDYRVRSSSIMTVANTKRLGDLMEIANELAVFFVSKTGFDKTVVYRAITQCYQRVFVDCPETEKRHLKQLCDWSHYRLVSRTKLRHRLNFWRNRLL